MTQRFADTFEPIKGHNGGEDMGRVGTLFATRFEETLLAQEDQQRLKQLHLSPSYKEATAKLAEHRGVKARIIQFQRQRIFPFNPTTYCIGGLPIRKSFGKLQHTYQSQAPWGECWLTIVRKKSGKLRIGVDRTQIITDTHDSIPFGKGCMSHTDRFFGDRIHILWFEGHCFPPYPVSVLHFRLAFLPI